MWSEECCQHLKNSRQGSSQLQFWPTQHSIESFVLETDASIKGLGAVLSQNQSDGKLHPVAFASLEELRCYRTGGSDGGLGHFPFPSPWVWK